ncbi:hypothetical protein GEMRC1_000782 [Eukaryota sp. GEM-RC1]
MVYPEPPLKTCRFPGTLFVTTDTVYSLSPSSKLSSRISGPLSASPPHEEFSTVIRLQHTLLISINLCFLRSTLKSSLEVNDKYHYDFKYHSLDVTMDMDDYFYTYSDDEFASYSDNDFRSPLLRIKHKLPLFYKKIVYVSRCFF